MPETTNQDAYLDALEPPVYVAGGRRYRGRILSADQWIRLGRVLERTPDDRRAQLRMIRYTVDQFFPPPSLWRRLRGERSVADHVAALPYAGQVRMFTSFTSAQAAIQEGQLPGPTPPTDGTSSPG